MLHQIHNSMGNFNYNAYIYTNVFWDFHFHENYELVYALEGDVRVTTNGISHLLHKGELILISPNTIHSLSADNASTWVGVFSEEYVGVFAKDRRQVLYSKFSLPKESEDFLKKELFFTGKPSKYMACACLYTVCDACTKGAEAISLGQSSSFIGTVTKYISENLSKDFDMNDLCDVLGYEYHYFSTLFNSTFHMRFKSFVAMYRIGRACALLSDKEKCITEVCDECGFGSIRNFNRVFKKSIGKTPSEYREEQSKI